MGVLPVMEVALWQLPRQRLLYEMLSGTLMRCSLDRSMQVPEETLDQTTSGQLGPALLFGISRRPWPMGKPQPLSARIVDLLMDVAAC